jgi:ABC-type transport system involved in Fe-S cluster assembly fused permease/ATPase subunit
VEAAIFGLTLRFKPRAKDIEYSRLVFQIVRLCGLLTLTGIGLLLLFPKKAQRIVPEEIQPLLSSTSDQGGDAPETTGYGSVNVQSPKLTDDPDVEKDGDDKKDEDDDEEEEDDELVDQTAKIRNGNWWSYAKTFSIYVSIVWPTGQVSHQLRFVGCALCLAAVRVLNILKPRQTGLVINSLLAASAHEENPWVMPIVLLAIYNLLGSSGGIPFLKSYLWAPVDYNMTANLCRRAYEHVMNLSSDFHDSKRSGPLWYSIYNAHSVTDMLELVFFEVLPVLFDFTFAAVYIYITFDPYLALIVFGCAVIYLWSSTAVVGRQNAVRRRSREAWKAERSVLTETTANWRTVSYFNRISHEKGRYSSAVNNVTDVRILLTLWSTVEWAIKACVLEVGLFLMVLIAGYKVVHGAPVGDVVTIMSFWGQIVYPLATIARAFSRFASTLVDSEELLVVLNKKPTIQNDNDARPLDVQQGEVEFENVGFSYDKKRGILKDVSFRATPGQTIALVGQTGGGKSTILKLLFRFYDPTNGSIKIDGQDIRHVTMESLRQIIGNVPQDAKLFNDTIMNNVRYAKPHATEEEVYEACKAAAIHDKILSFTKGYQTKVGEGGIKVSGGELQRIAIARAILQDPQIVLLDEATSSVDTETEACIQESLKRLTSGRTTFVVAHRLSTIVNADLILVVHNGEIVERGTHQKLMGVKKAYYKLWTKQMIPKAERGRSRSAAKRASSSDYLNDLDTDFGCSQVKKSARDSGEADDGPSATGTAGEDSEDNRKKEQNNDNSGRAALSKGLGSSMMRFWKPDAPEFVPKSSHKPRKTAPEHPSESQSPKLTGLGSLFHKDKDGGNQEASTKDKGRQKASYEPEGHKRKTDQSFEAQDGSMVTEPGESSLTDTESQHAPGKGASAADEGSQGLPKQKKRRFNRRDQSKSEPAGVRLQTDGTEDLDTTPEGSGEQSVSKNKRRVSASSDPPHHSATKTTTRANPLSRRRRRRQWRKRNLNGSQTSSTIVTTGSSSMNSPTFHTPTAPPASPAQGATVTELLPSGSVRFAEYS